MTLVPPGFGFGQWGMTLLLPTLLALALATAIASRRSGQPANLLLAGLLLALAGLLIPYAIGYAGAYDAWPWLTYAPLQVPLAVGPLAWGHVRALTTGRALTWRHMLLPGFQFSYQAVLFVLPLATRWRFAERIDEPWLSPVLGLALVVTLPLYAWAAWREAQRYRAWIVPRRADLSALIRVEALLAALALLVATLAGLELFERLVRPLDYFGRFPAYVALALLTAWLAIEGWRQSERPMPRPALVTGIDWTAKGQAWQARLIEEGWWRDADLDLAALARRLGTNSTTLSRAFNEGIGQSLPELLAGIRSRAVADALAAGDPRDVLAIALEAGFGSKAAFNRAFKATMGAPPSAFRVSKATSSAR